MLPVTTARNTVGPNANTNAATSTESIIREAGLHKGVVWSQLMAVLLFYSCVALLSPTDAW
jgi:hypothetical protein